MVILKDLHVWLRPEDLGAEASVKFTDEGRTVSKEETGFGEDGFEIGVILPSNEKRVWTMNKTSQRAVARVLGFDTSLWIGKSVQLTVSEVVVSGQRKKAIFVSGEIKK